MTMKVWMCSKCGQETVANERPTSLPWSDGHRCVFREVTEDELLADQIIKALESDHGLTLSLTAKAKVHSIIKESNNG